MSPGDEEDPIKCPKDDSIADSFSKKNTLEKKGYEGLEVTAVLVFGIAKSRFLRKKIARTLIVVTLSR